MCILCTGFVLSFSHHGCMECTHALEVILNMPQDKHVNLVTVNIKKKYKMCNIVFNLMRATGSFDIKH